jgi:hypothetical protein
MNAPVSRPDPVSPLVQRLVAASGIAFAVLFVLTILISGDETPDDGAALAEWTQFARDNEDNTRIAALVFALATYNFLLFLGFLRNEIAEAELRTRGFARADAIVLAAGAVGIAGLLGAVTITDPDTPPEILKATYDLSGAGFGLAAAAMGACLVTVGLVNVGVRALPAWLGWVALASGIAFVLQLGILLAEDEDNFFGIFFPIAFLGLVIFCAGASVTFLRATRR